MSKIFSLFFVVVLALCIFSCSFALAQNDEPVTISTPLGPIIGLKNHYGGYKFRGLPFAVPPVGKLRLQPPVPLQPWTTPYNGTYFRNGCYQSCHAAGKFAKLLCAANNSEDCLYLNVYTPTLNPDAKLPVYFFQHGGMWTWGSSQIELYSGSHWAARENIVIVEINYRLNIFSGLMTSHIPGNYGLRDQIQALKWVNQMISSFGGDPNRVTLSGQSSGAFGVNILHASAPSSWPYFHAVAPLSSPIGFIPATKKMATELGELATLKAGCKIGSDTTAEEQLACLQALSAEDFFKLSKTDYLPTPNEVLELILQWQPAVDGELVLDTPINRFQQGKFNRVPMYFSNVANETAIFVNGINFQPDTLLLDIALDYIFGLADAKQVEDLYGPIPTNFTWNDPNGMMFFSTILTDYTFLCPTMYTADLVSSYGLPVYGGLYDIVESWVPWYDNNTKDICNILPCHAYDMPSLFYDPYSLPKYFPPFPSAEQGLSHFMQHVVGSVVKGTTGGLTSYNTTNRFMYNYSLPLPRPLLSQHRQKYCAMWDKIGYNRR